MRRPLTIIGMTASVSRRVGRAERARFTSCSRIYGQNCRNFWCRPAAACRVAGLPFLEGRSGLRLCMASLNGRLLPTNPYGKNGRPHRIRLSVNCVLGRTAATGLPTTISDRVGSVRPLFSAGRRGQRGRSGGRRCMVSVRPSSGLRRRWLGGHCGRCSSGPVALSCYHTRQRALFCRSGRRTAVIRCGGSAVGCPTMHRGGEVFQRAVFSRPLTGVCPDRVSGGGGSVSVTESHDAA